MLLVQGPHGTNIQMAELVQRGVFSGDNDHGYKLTEFGEDVAIECCLRWDAEIEVCFVACT